MGGIVFFRTTERARLVEFYINRLGATEWLEQAGGCTILNLDSLLLGFCDGDTTETQGIVTKVVADRDAVDTWYDELSDIARGPPEMNDAFDIYQFFLTDPDGRSVEIQTFLHEVPVKP